MDCLKINLPGSIDNEALLKIDEVAIDVNFSSSMTAANRKIVVVYNGTDDRTIRLVGDGHFTDSTLTQDLGNEIVYNKQGGGLAIYVSDGKSTIIFGSKYNLTYLNVDTDSNVYNKTISNGFWGKVPLVSATLRRVNFGLYKLDDFNFKSCVDFDVSYTDIEGSFSGDIFSASVVNNINIVNTKFAAKLSDFSSLTNLTTLYLNGSKTEGDIFSIASLTKLTTLDISNLGNVGGQLSSLVNNTSLKNIYASNSGIEGSINDLNGKTTIGLLNVRNCNVDGSLNDFLDSIFNAGKTSGYITIVIDGSEVTYNGSKVSWSYKNFVFSSTGWSEG